jgi:hypothetical protein
MSTIKHTLVINAKVTSAPQRVAFLSIITKVYATASAEYFCVESLCNGIDEISRRVNNTSVPYTSKIGGANQEQP